MYIYIASDHAGINLKEGLVKYLKEQKYNVNDLGPQSTNAVDYPDYALKVAQSVVKQNNAIGILICGTGFGMAIAANKVKGIRATSIIRSDMAPLARQHNNANIITLSARFNNLEENIKIVDTFLKAQFEGGRHQDRLNKITKIEDEC
jgi:ribose 5-phosphate isomerase B